MASAVSEVSTSASPAVRVCPSLNTRCRTSSTAATRGGSASASGGPKRAPARRSVARARLSRCAMVDSGTRKAAAISVVPRPATARRVSATCEGRVSEGWQHRSSSCRLSSAAAPATSSAAGVTSATASAATATSRAVRARAARPWSTSRREATRISHARGLSGTPSRGHCRAAASRASWAASSQSARSPCRRSRAPRTCDDSRRHTSSSTPVVTGARPLATSPVAARPSPPVRRSASPPPRRVAGSRRRSGRSRRGAPWPRSTARR